jgi:hypothetical protein
VSYSFSQDATTGERNIILSLFVGSHLLFSSIICREGTSAMDKQEQEILESLRNSFENGFSKDCVDAYLKEPSAAAITNEALKRLKSLINESD